MNLNEFLSYRIYCPICNNKLITKFHSNRKQKIRYENDRLLVIYPMFSLKRTEKHYQAVYSFGMYTNEFYIDFYDKNGIKLEYIPLSIISRFKSLNENLFRTTTSGLFQFYRSCNICNNYYYINNHIDPNLLNIKSCDYSIYMEYFGLLQECKDGYNAYKLYNIYKDKKSCFVYGKINLENMSLYKKGFNVIKSNDFRNSIETELITFNNVEKTIERLNKLILFS